ncbi:MAG: D-glycero-beta-D-manno-heptose-7-phosphate kinase [Deltaproteobacteria bacterium]|nr:D-glycero-beta-D-manno-heptose-7-phosphate kinase [Deltaproteobacteria bacterium]
MNQERIREILGKIRNRKILVVGDVMVDEYVWGQIDRISPEAPIQVVDVHSENTVPGGGANVVANLVGLGARVYLGSVVGKDAKGDLLRERLRKQGVRIQGMITDRTRPTSTKTRIMGRNQQLLRIDREDRTPLRPETEQRLLAYLKKQIPLCDAVILSDYGKGILTEKILTETIRNAAKEGKIITADPKGKDFKKYRGITCLTPNRREAEEATGRILAKRSEIREAAEQLQRVLHSPACLITLGGDGMALRERNRFTFLSTAAREVFDVSGAGDTVIAALTLVAAAGYSLKEAAEIANLAAGVVVGKVGTAHVAPREILDHAMGAGGDRTGKIFSFVELKEEIRRKKALGKKVIFTNGCFDLLHVGHIRYLQEARALGDLLVLGLNSDDSVRKLKGKLRPLISQEERALILAALDCIDYVVIFEERTPLKLIRELQPDVLVKGGDYKKSEVVGGNLVEAAGGRVALIPIVRGKSTSGLVERIVERYGKEQGAKGQKRPKNFL